MTCRTCGYEAAYDLPTCPRCGAVAGASLPAAPTGVPPESTPTYAAGGPNPTEEPSAVERTINRAALRAELARGGSIGTSTNGPAAFANDLPPVEVIPDGPWLSNGGGDAAYPSLPSVPPAAPELPAVPGATGYPPVLGPSFAEGAAGAGPTPATLGERFLANVVDGLVMSACMIPFGLASTLLGAKRGLGVIIAYILSLALVVILVTYAPLLVGRHGRTIGKNVMRIEVQDIRTGHPIGVGAAFGRWLMLGLMGAPCYLGYLSILLDKSGYHRGWHDSTANSRVVKTTTQIPVSTLLRLRG
jgi:uncharacterized RDD family membrane protein YckC